MMDLFDKKSLWDMPNIIPLNFLHSVLVIDKSSGQIISKPFGDTKQSLRINFEEDMENPMKSKIEILSEINYTIKNGGAIKIIDLPKIFPSTDIEGQSR